MNTIIVGVVLFFVLLGPVAVGSGLVILYYETPKYIAGISDIGGVFGGVCMSALGAILTWLVWTVLGIWEPAKDTLKWLVDFGRFCGSGDKWISKDLFLRCPECGANVVRAYHGGSPKGDLYFKQTPFFTKIACSKCHNWAIWPRSARTYKVKRYMPEWNLKYHQPIFSMWADDMGLYHCPGCGSYNVNQPGGCNVGVILVAAECFDCGKHSEVTTTPIL